MRQFWPLRTKECLEDRKRCRDRAAATQRDRFNVGQSHGRKRNAIHRDRKGSERHFAGMPMPTELARPMAERSRMADVHTPKMLQDARKAGLVKLRCSAGGDDGCPVWAEPCCSDLSVQFLCRNKKETYRLPSRFLPGVLQVQACGRCADVSRYRRSHHEDSKRLPSLGICQNSPRLRFLPRVAEG